MRWLKNWLIGRERKALVKRMTAILEEERNYHRAEADKQMLEHKQMLDQAYRNVIRENEYLKRLIIDDMNLKIDTRMIVGKDNLC